MEKLVSINGVGYKFGTVMLELFVQDSAIKQMGHKLRIVLPMEGLGLEGIIAAATEAEEKYIANLTGGHNEAMALAKKYLNTEFVIKIEEECNERE